MASGQPHSKAYRKRDPEGRETKLLRTRVCKPIEDQPSQLAAAGIGYLAAMGILKVRHGVGTFVAEGSARFACFLNAPAKRPAWIQSKADV